jgi:Protein kinase domain
MDALQPGDPRWVGRYRLLSRLGTGGMGRVFLGQSPSGRLVAVKLIRPELADDPGFRRRFAQEVSAARRVSGIFTAPVVDADSDCSQPWLVTAYVAGPSLTDAIEARGPMPVESVLTLAAGLAEGLGAVHAAGVVHRDLKPSNVLLASDGPRIIDFGISRAADSAWLTVAGGVVGSPGFMSPEQAEGRLVGPPADIFSLGGVLAYAATGEPPFGAGSASALLYRVVYGTAATGHVPAQLRQLIERCLAKDPADRPTTDELLADLGYAEADADWLSWQGSATRAASEMPATELDMAGAPDQAGGVPTGQTKDGNGAVGAAPGLPVAAVGTLPPPPDPGHHGRHSRPRWSPRPRRAHRRNSALIGCVVAGVLAAGAALGVVIAVASQHEQDRTGAALPPASQVHRHGSGTIVAALPLGVTAPGPRAVIDSYFAAINHRHWRKVWRLGGENLGQSYDAMVDGYTSTARDVIQSVAVVGSHAYVVVRAREVSGVTQLYQMDFLIQDGVIVRARQLLLAS